MWRTGLMPERMCHELQPIGTWKSWVGTSCRNHLEEVDKLQPCVDKGAQSKGNRPKSDILVNIQKSSRSYLSIIDPWLFSLSEVISFTSISPTGEGDPCRSQVFEKTIKNILPTHDPFQVHCFPQLHAKKAYEYVSQAFLQHC